MPKEKSINPAQAQRKADKAKAIKKGKAQVQTQRTERLAKKNPDRLQKQLDDLKALESTGQKLTSHEKTLLESLERDVKAVRKARETLGDKAPKLGFRGERDGRGGRDSGRGGFGGGLGKRKREDGDSSEDSDVPDEVKRIPMPRDTPPPIPKEVLDKWYQKRRERMGHTQNQNHNRDSAGRGANSTPLGDNARQFGSGNGTGEERPKPVMEAKTTYSAAPVIRDLRKEAVSFVPAAVRAKLDKSKGVGGLVEPEEMDRLEKAGYIRSEEKGSVVEARTEHEKVTQGVRAVEIEDVEDEDG